MKVFSGKMWENHLSMKVLVWENVGKSPVNEGFQWENVGKSSVNEGFGVGKCGKITCK